MWNRPSKDWASLLHSTIPTAWSESRFAEKFWVARCRNSRSLTRPFIARCPRLLLLMPDLLSGLRKDSYDTVSMGPAFGTRVKERLGLSVARMTRTSVKSSAIWEAGVLWPQCAEPDA